MNDAGVCADADGAEVSVRKALLKSNVKEITDVMDVRQLNRFYRAALWTVVVGVADVVVAPVVVNVADGAAVAVVGDVAIDRRHSYCRRTTNVGDAVAVVAAAVDDAAVAVATPQQRPNLNWDRCR